MPLCRRFINEGYELNVQDGFKARRWIGTINTRHGSYRHAFSCEGVKNADSARVRTCMRGAEDTDALRS